VPVVRRNVKVRRTSPHGSGDSSSCPGGGLASGSAHERLLRLRPAGDVAATVRCSRNGPDMGPAEETDPPKTRDGRKATLSSSGFPHRPFVATAQLCGNGENVPEFSGPGISCASSDGMARTFSPSALNRRTKSPPPGRTWRKSRLQRASMQGQDSNRLCAQVLVDDEPTACLAPQNAGSTAAALSRHIIDDTAPVEAIEAGDAGVANRGPLEIVEPITLFQNPGPSGLESAARRRKTGMGSGTEPEGHIVRQYRQQGVKAVPVYDLAIKGHGRPRRGEPHVSIFAAIRQGALEPSRDRAGRCGFRRRGWRLPGPRYCPCGASASASLPRRPPEPR